MAETDLYQPIKERFESAGYDVKGEVDGCDLVAVRGGDIVIVELKRSVNLTAILQCIDRKKLTDNVYLAVEAPANPRRSRWREVIRLCRMLAIGLITVSSRRRIDPVEIVCEPGPYKPQMNGKRKVSLISEFERRSGDHNVGGSTRRPLVTAYREEALRIAAFLEQNGPAQVRDVRQGAGIERSGTILRDNYYDWFERVSRGVYELSPRGRQALRDYKEVVAQLANPLPSDPKP